MYLIGLTLEIQGGRMTCLC